MGSHFRNISRETYHKIEVQTTEKLEISQAGGFDSWIISDQFYGNKQIIEVEMGTKNKRSWKLYIYNPRSGQTEVVEFQTDMEYASNKVESKV